MFTERSNAYHLLVPLFSSFMGSVVCHMLPLFGQSPLSIISFVIPSLTLCLCFLFQSCLLLRWSPPQSAIFGISHAAHAGARDNTRMQY